MIIFSILDIPQQMSTDVPTITNLSIADAGIQLHSPECECWQGQEFCNNKVRIEEKIASLPPEEQIKYTDVPPSALQLYGDHLSFKGSPDEYSCCCITCVAAAVAAAGPCHKGKCTSYWDDLHCTTCTKEHNCVWCYKGLKKEREEHQRYLADMEEEQQRYLAEQQEDEMMRQVALDEQKEQRQMGRMFNALYQKSRKKAVLVPT